MTVLETTRHLTQRVRREVRRRRLRVSDVQRLTPKMLRIRFSSPDLQDFESLGPDDHVKLFLPFAASLDPAEPSSTPGGERLQGCMRDYTPRAFDTREGTLTIDFALHQSGPATDWALQARIGDTLEIGGPRGSQVVADDFDWYLLIGDETALPAIGRRVEALRPGVPVTTVVVVDDEAERQVFSTRANWRAVWLTRIGGELADAGRLRAALDEHELPAGDGYVWIAAEAGAARALRAYMLEERGHPRTWLKASGYWSRGQAAIHDGIQD